MTYTKMIVIASFLLIVLFLPEESALALQGGIATPQLDAAGQSTGLSSGDPRVFVATMIQGALGILGTIFAGLLILAGYWFLIARGREEYIENAKTTMLRAVIGLIIVLLSYSVTTLIKTALTTISSDNTIPERSGSLF